MSTRVSPSSAKWRGALFLFASLLCFLGFSLASSAPKEKNESLNLPPSVFSPLYKYGEHLRPLYLFDQFHRTRAPDGTMLRANDTPIAEKLLPPLNARTLHRALRSPRVRMVKIPNEQLFYWEPFETDMEKCPINRIPHNIGPKNITSLNNWSIEFEDYLRLVRQLKNSRAAMTQFYKSREPKKPDLTKFKDEITQARVRREYEFRLYEFHESIKREVHMRNYARLMIYVEGKSGIITARRPALPHELIWIAHMQPPHWTDVEHHLMHYSHPEERFMYRALKRVNKILFELFRYQGLRYDLCKLKQWMRETGQSWNGGNVPMDLRYIAFLVAEHNRKKLTSLHYDYVAFVLGDISHEELMKRDPAETFISKNLQKPEPKFGDRKEELERSYALFHRRWVNQYPITNHNYYNLLGVRYEYVHSGKAMHDAEWVKEPEIMPVILPKREPLKKKPVRIRHYY